MNSCYLYGENRYKRSHITPYAINLVQHRNPWVIIWWSAAFPGLGHMLLGKSVKGLIFLLWEILANMKSSLNTAIFYSFTGNFDLAREVADVSWLAIYAGAYIFIIWDSYHLTVELNKVSKMAERERPSLQFMKINSNGHNFLKQFNPRLTAVWSAFMPGLGHLRLQRSLTGFTLLVSWISITGLSHMYNAVQFTCTGSFSKALDVLNLQWLLFLPSIFVFAIYGSYVDAVEINKLYQAEQRSYLVENYQNPAFDMPV
ncbi:hypothetical protein Psfp_00610 [Pelotomaculum sp. FP]|uniref:hypothetical protein n=1 Tax=Pelotomaculum sp. FP TaxID=261474 RepID=UPI001064E15B|nr:hypothetical protein [Pelotomaculum sp. FP]TEB17386.1 hypothetical protein Psfp_00610 [Pelotomaculum sp. FP]